MLSTKEAYVNKNSLKYVIGYNDNDIIRPLRIRLPKMTSYARKFNENVTMSFKVYDKKNLKNYYRIWEKIENLMRKDFDSRPVYGDNDKYIKIKM